MCEQYHSSLFVVHCLMFLIVLLLVPKGYVHPLGQGAWHASGVTLLGGSHLVGRERCWVRGQGLSGEGDIRTRDVTFIQYFVWLVS